jgi:hypothetical protein
LSKSDNFQSKYVRQRVVTIISAKNVKTEVVAKMQRVNPCKNEKCKKRDKSRKKKIKGLLHFSKTLKSSAPKSTN